MQRGPFPKCLTPLSWLVGRWKSVSAEGIYETITPFNYNAELNFECLGQPMLNYTSHSWHPVKLTPMHIESGFLRIKQDTNEVAFVIVHNFGLTCLEEGIVNGNKLTLTTSHITRMKFAKEPRVLKMERTFEIVENNKLMMTTMMETDKTKMQQHLKAIYVKV